MPPRKDVYAIEDEIAVDASPESVMAKILDATSWPHWQSEIRSISGPRRVQEGDDVTGEARLAGFDVEGFSRARAIGDATFVQDVVVGVRMQVSYEVSSTPEGTVIKHRLETQLPAGALGSVLSAVLKWRLKTMQKKLLAKLAAQASEGSG